MSHPEHSQQAGYVAIFRRHTRLPHFPTCGILFLIAFIHDNLAMLKYHRYITHSLILLPLWALLLTPLIRWGARKFSGCTHPPSFVWIFLATAVGIASHLLLDSRHFIRHNDLEVPSAALVLHGIFYSSSISLSAAILLVPQFAIAWIHRFKAHNILRASRMWALSTVLALGILWFASAVGFPFSIWIQCPSPA